MSDFSPSTPTDTELSAGHLETGMTPSAPGIPSHGPIDWAKKNLFSSKTNTVQTLIFGLIGYSALSFVSGLVLSDERDWSSVWTNMRLLFSYTYPTDQYIRIWVSLGAVLVAATMSLAAFKTMPRIRLRKITESFVSAGALLTLIAFVSIVRIGFISIEFDSPNGTVLGILLVGLALIGISIGVQQFLGIDRDDERTIPVLVLIAGFAAVVVALLWLVPFGRYEFSDGEVTYEPGTVNITTKLPWTIMMGLFVAGYYIGLAVKRVVGARPFSLLMILWWVAGPAFLIFLVLRDPAFDWDHILSTDLPMALGFAFGGGALLYVLSKPGLEELARGVGALLLVYAAFNWLAAFGDITLPFTDITINWQWYPWASPPAGVDGTAMLQKARISFLLLAFVALMAPNFAGELRARLRFVGAWIGFMLLMHWLITGINTPSTLQIVQPPFLGGFTLSIVIAYYVMLASFPIGIIMALARTSKLPLFRIMATGYIEFVRGVPLITVLFFFSNIVNLFLPDGMELAELGAIFLGYSLFSGAYMAENIRGGLQSVRQGQFEASDALGLTSVQRTAFIVLPQALRVSIPNLVGQAIATFKETSLIAIIGGFDFLQVANRSIPSQPDFIGQNLPALLFISVVYWAVSYSMSRSSRALETKLGVGTR